MTVAVLVFLKKDIGVSLLLIISVEINHKCAVLCLLTKICHQYEVFLYSELRQIYKTQSTNILICKTIVF